MEILHDINPDRLLGDKGYDSDDIRNDLADRGIEPVIPPRSNRKTPIEYDREAYKRRNLIMNDASIVSSSSVASQPATRKLPEPISRCYVSRQQDSGLKPSTRPSRLTDYDFSKSYHWRSPAAMASARIPASSA